MNMNQCAREVNWKMEELVVYVLSVWACIRQVKGEATIEHCDCFGMPPCGSFYPVRVDILFSIFAMLLFSWQHVWLAQTFKFYFIFWRDFYCEPDEMIGSLFHFYFIFLVFISGWQVLASSESERDLIWESIISWFWELQEVISFHMYGKQRYFNFILFLSLTDSSLAGSSEDYCCCGFCYK